MPQHGQLAERQLRPLQDGLPAYRGARRRAVLAVPHYRKLRERSYLRVRALQGIVAGSR
jgi:hypothetical protein